MEHVLRRLTQNGADNLIDAIERPNRSYPGMFNGITTGRGKWTHIAARGVENHLKTLGLAELQPVKLNGRIDEQNTMMLAITPLGRAVAERLIASPELRYGLRDLSGKPR